MPRKVTKMLLILRPKEPNLKCKSLINPSINKERMSITTKDVTKIQQVGTDYMTLNI